MNQDREGRTTAHSPVKALGVSPEENRAWAWIWGPSYIFLQQGPTLPVPPPQLPGQGGGSSKQ